MFRPLDSVSQPRHTDPVGVELHEDHFVPSFGVVIVAKDPCLVGLFRERNQIVVVVTAKLTKAQRGPFEVEAVSRCGEAQEVPRLGSNVVSELELPLRLVVNHVGVENPIPLPGSFWNQDRVRAFLGGGMDPARDVFQTIDQLVIQKQLLRGSDIAHRRPSLYRCRTACLELGAEQQVWSV